MAIEELARLLSTLDVFVVPSQQEGLCLAALEAMAAGCPVVSTRCGGPEEFVQDGQTGFLSDASPESLAHAIARLVEDRELRARCAFGARALVERSYTRSTAAAAFWAAFDALASRESA